MGRTGAAEASPTNRRMKATQNLAILILQDTKNENSSELLNLFSLHGQSPELQWELIVGCESQGSLRGLVHKLIDWRCRDNNRRGHFVWWDKK